jgi:HEAT repeat protein
MHSADDLLQGLHDTDWMVRFEVVDRLIARAREDERTLTALIAAANDSVPAVREVVVMRLHNFDDERALIAIRRAMSDDDPDVRWAAEFAARQTGE